MEKIPEAKKILITTESHEFFIVRELGPGRRGLCHECDEEVGLLTLDEAVISAAIGTRKVMFLIEEGSVHSVEASSGHLLVCQNSLRNYLHEEEGICE